MAHIKLSTSMGMDDIIPGLVNNGEDINSRVKILEKKIDLVIALQNDVSGCRSDISIFKSEMASFGKKIDMMQDGVEEIRDHLFNDMKEKENRITRLETKGIDPSIISSELASIKTKIKDMSNGKNGMNRKMMALIIILAAMAGGGTSEIISLLKMALF